MRCTAPSPSLGSSARHYRSSPRATRGSAPSRRRRRGGRQAVELLVAELERGGGEDLRELVLRARARDRGDDVRLGAQPGERAGGDRHAGGGGGLVERLEHGVAAALEIHARGVGPRRLDRRAAWPVLA